MNASYDSENDILFLHKGFGHDEEFKTNLVYGDLILDVSSKGRVCGLEIMNATQYLSVPKKDLIELQSANFEPINRKESLLIRLNVNGKDMANLVLAIG